MNNEARSLNIGFNNESPIHWYATVTVPAHIVNLVYKDAVFSQQNNVDALGFGRGAIPSDYIEQHLKSTLLDHVKEFLLNFWVINFLFDEIRKRKLVMAGYPRLHNIDVSLGQDASFTFEMSRSPELQLLEWHYFPFKSPKRKNYKDLDRQVDLFLKEEKENLKNCSLTTLSTGDWVNFEISLADSNNTIYKDAPTENLWLRLGEEEVDAPLRNLFINKQIDDQFFSSDITLQEYYSSQLNTNYNFAIKINDVVKHAFFCLDQFKKHFRIKSNKELQQKLIEVFSYRNDISLRRNIVEECLRLLLAKHKFDVPHSLVLRQQQTLLDTISTNPDYHVYRAQKDFQIRLRQLAEKQAKETLLIDHISYSDDLDVNITDLKGYINLIQRPRTKEFIYFDPPLTKMHGQELPISSSLFKQNCLREKALNHVIHNLSKQ